MKQQATSSKEGKEGFTMIPHSVFEWLLTADLNKREQKVVWLVVRLQYGCPRYVGAQFRQADLTAVGIIPSHAKEVINSLKKKKVLIENRQFNRFELNVGVRKESEPLFRLRRLIHRNSYRRGNNSTTISVTSLLPKEEAKTYHKSKYGNIPEQELNSYPKHELQAAKDNETKVKAGKRIKVAGEVIDLATFRPRGEVEEVAFETWQMFEPENHKRLGFYLNLAKTGLSADHFRLIRSEAMTCSDVSSRGKLFNRKAVEFIRQRLAVGPHDHV